MKNGEPYFDFCSEKFSYSVSAASVLVMSSMTDPTTLDKSNGSSSMCSNKDESSRRSMSTVLNKIGFPFFDCSALTFAKFSRNFR